MPIKNVIGVGLIAGVAYYFLLFDDGSALDAQIQTLQQNIVEETAKKKKTEETLEKEKEVKANVETLTRQYLEISKRVPTSLNTIDISRVIDQMARNASVEIKSKKPGSIITGGLFEELPVELTLKGTYTGIAQFIYFISINERIMRLKAFSIDSSSDSNKLQLTGTFVGYRIAPEPKKQDTKEASEVITQ